LAGNPSEGVWGSAYKHFNEGKVRREGGKEGGRVGGRKKHNH
jgi:hypothetical protein